MGWFRGNWFKANQFAAQWFGETAATPPTSDGRARIPVYFIAPPMRRPKDRRRRHEEDLLTIIL